MDGQQLFAEVAVMKAVQSGTLRQGISQALAGASDVAALLGGVRIYAEAPHTPTFPYITLGQSAVRDWTRGADNGAEQRLTLHIWSPFGGKKHVQDIIKAIRMTLEGRPLVLSNRDRMTLQHEFSEARLDPDGDSFHGIIRYRASAAPVQAAAA
jgi:hypothetical protein